MKENKKDKLTARQEKFVQNIIRGMTQREAYKKSFNPKNSSDKTIDETACKLFNTPKIQTRYNELLQKMEDKAIMSAEERLKFLTQVVNDEQTEDVFYNGIRIGNRKADISTKIRAIDTMNKMTGEYKTILDGSVEVNKKLEDLL